MKVPTDDAKQTKTQNKTKKPPWEVIRGVSLRQAPVTQGQFGVRFLGCDRNPADFD